LIDRPLNGNVSEPEFKELRIVEMTWLMRARITAAAAVGILLIGLLCWSMVKPDDPYGIVTLKNLTAPESLMLAVLSVIAGFTGYFASWPYGREIGILTVPFGLSIWAIRSGSMANLMQMNPLTDDRLSLLGYLRWEPIFWMGIIAAGYCGVLLAENFKKPVRPEIKEKHGLSKQSRIINAAIAVAGSVAIAGFGIMIFGHNNRLYDDKFGAIVAQPVIGQIIFAVIVSFGISGFFTKKYLKVSYIWPALAAIFISPLFARSYGDRLVVEYLAINWPANFFINSIVSILPIQMVALGAIGSVVGFWTAKRYLYWRENESG
jgi:hypothetical protein